MTTFTCPDGTVHPWSRRCDGIKDCPYYEDEKDCDGKAFLNKMFICTHHHQLHVLHPNISIIILILLSNIINMLYNNT